jgi:hypothetical protein
MEVRDEFLSDLRHKVVNVMQRFKRTQDTMILRSLTEILDMINKGIDEADEPKG